MRRPSSRALNDWLRPQRNCIHTNNASSNSIGASPFFYPGIAFLKLSGACRAVIPFHWSVVKIGRNFKSIPLYEAGWFWLRARRSAGRVFAGGNKDEEQGRADLLRDGRGHCCAGWCHKVHGKRGLQQMCWHGRSLQLIPNNLWHLAQGPALSGPCAFVPPTNGDTTMHLV